MRARLRVLVNARVSARVRENYISFKLGLNWAYLQYYWLNKRGAEDR